MQLHVMHSVTKVVQHRSICATTALIKNATLAACDQCSKAMGENCLLRFSLTFTSLGLLAYHDLQVKAFMKLL